MKRIVVLNPKGGSGKTTLAINLASYYASRQQKPVLMDFDPQGSSVRWAKKRQAGAAAHPRHRRLRERRAHHARLPAPHSCARHSRDRGYAGRASIRPSCPTSRATRTRSSSRCCRRTSTFMPASRIIRDLLLVAKIRREDDRIGVIANRIRRNTLTYQSLIRFLQTLGIPIITTIRDSQNYVRAAELGIGVHEMKSYVAREDVEQWEPLVEWLSKPSANEPSAPAAAPPRSGKGSV